MCGFFKKIFRLGAITAGVIGLSAVVAYATFGGPRTRAMVHEMHGRVLEEIDEHIDDPTAMRAQLHEMEREYPERIAQVRSDLAELEAEIRGLQREQSVSERVVALVDADLGTLQGELAARTSEATNGALVALREIPGEESGLTPKRATAKLRQMQEQRLVYANRANDAQHDLVYLQKQRDRLSDLLSKLETERAEFQSQILGLSRQIDAIARNDRLIQLLDRRNKTIEECSRYEAISLEQITGRLAQITSRQEAELDVLSSAEEATDYEDMARFEIANEELAAQQGGADGF